MEKHKCKLCSRTFGNGRALGGHMKAHLAIAKSQKQALNVTDPEFAFIHDKNDSVIVPDRESDTDSKTNPTRQQRSKRSRKQNINHNFCPKKLKLDDHEPVSSVSDTSPEEDVAICLMMLSRDKWINNGDELELETEMEQVEVKPLKRIRGKHLCEECGKMFRSSRALGSHKSVCCNAGEGKNCVNDKIFECPFCFKVFGSGQALGGHKRSHLIIPPSSSNNNANVNVNPSVRFKQSFIDLNLPAPFEDEEQDDDLSVVSDA